MRVVVDTNVIVSALLKPTSVPDRAIEALWAHGATVLYDARVADEYRSVLGRPKFASIDRGRIDDMLALFFSRGHDVGQVAPWQGALTDEDDRIFVELALFAAADAIVTGNIKDYPLGLGFDVFPPATLLARLTAG